MTLLSVDRLSVRYGATEVLRDVSLAVEPGEIVTIVGPNGSGKTTLLRAIVGAVPLAAGKVRKTPGLVLGYVPQRLHVDPTLPITVARFLRLPGGAGRPNARRRLRAQACRISAGGRCRICRVDNCSGCSWPARSWRVRSS